MSLRGMISFTLIGDINTTLMGLLSGNKPSVDNAVSLF